MIKGLSNNLYFNEQFVRLSLSKPCQTSISLIYRLRLTQTNRIFRDALNKAIICSFLICLLSASTHAQSPNIIFILADDLGYGDLGCYGQQKIKTPNIDALAKSGIKFTQYYSGSTVCAPARASFMTGLHTGHTPVRGNQSFEPEGQSPLPDSSVTIAMELQKAGYTTAAFGKWSLGFITTSGATFKKRV